MGPQKVYFDSIVAKSKNHMVRAKVISKTTRKGRQGKQDYQRLMLLDEKGLTMKAVLFGHNVDHFDEIISEDQCYDMSNLVLSPVDPGFQAYPGKHQIHINTSSSVKKVDMEESTFHFESKLSKLSDIPRETHPCNATFDMMAVVLHFTPPRKVMNKKTNKESDLSELYITDDSCSEAVLLSLWNDYALACGHFEAANPCGAVVAVSGLKTKDYNGFSLSTTFHSKLNFNPTGDRANELRKWFDDNRATVLDQVGIDLKKKEFLPADIPITKIERALAMTIATDVTGEDVVKISAYVPDLTIHTLRLSVSCNLCGQVCDVPPNVSYLCDKCQNYTFSTTKMFFDFTATDGTGTLKLSTNSKTAEQLLKITSSEFHKMTHKERASFADTVSTTLRSSKIEMILSPLPTFLMDHNKLVWRLKEIL